MKAPFEKTFAQLQYATPVKARQILREFERSPEDIANFCRQARRLPPSKATVLCPILSAMNAPEYMELLRDYVLRTEEALQKDALNAFARANPSARRNALLTLLRASDDKVRREVCAMLGAEGEEAAAKLLVKLLNDPSFDVVMAALSGIENSGLISAYPECCSLLTHAEGKIRAKALQVISSFDSKIPENQVINLLSSDPDINVRKEAAHALARHPEPQAMQVLLQILSNQEEEISLRISTGQTLEHYNDITAAHGLFKICAHGHGEASLIQICQNSLLRMKESILEQLCDEAFNSDDIATRLSGATLAGMIGTIKTQTMLVNRLHKESEPLVIAGLLEEAGRCGATDAWDFSLNMLTNVPLIAYAAAQALARLLVPAKLNEFVNLLKGQHELIIFEVILQRLASYGKARELPAQTAPAIKPLLMHEYSNIAVLAAEAAARIEGNVLLPDMLQAMQSISREEVKRALSDGILTAIDQKLSRLVQITPGKNMCEVSGVLSRASELHDNDPEGLLIIADASVNKVPCANCCLIVAGCLMPQSFALAMQNANANQVVPLLQSWRFLPKLIRNSVTPPWKKLLTSAEASVRLLCLKAMDGFDAMPMVGAIADLAFLDHDEQVVLNAKKLLVASLEVDE